MKHLSKALFAVSIFTAVAAADAQVSYFGTNFDGSTTYPYSDNTVYNQTTPLNGQGGFTSTTANDPNSSPASPAAVAFANGAPLNTVGTLAQDGTGADNVSHAFQAVTGGFTFNTDFSVQGVTLGANNTYAFNFTNPAGIVFGITFTPFGATNNAPAIGLTSFTIPGTAATGSTTYLNGTGSTSATPTVNSPGADVGSYYHLTVQITNAGQITATYAGLTATGAINGNFTAATPVVTNAFAGNGITGLSVAETTSTGGGNDYIIFDNISVVPEPSTYTMMGLGLLGTLSLMRLRRKA